MNQYVVIFNLNQKEDHVGCMYSIYTYILKAASEKEVLEQAVSLLFENKDELNTMCVLSDLDIKTIKNVYFDKMIADINEYFSKIDDEKLPVLTIDMNNLNQLFWFFKENNYFVKITKIN